LAQANRQDLEVLQPGPKNRQILMLGHDIQGDLEYLKSLGSKIFTASRGTYPIAAMEMMGTGEGHAQTLASIIEALDTAPLYRVLKQETQNRSLGSILKDLGLPCYALHNGGNDARYTLEALIAMVVKARLEDDEVGKKEDQTRECSDGWGQHDTTSNVDGPSDAAGSKGRAPSTPRQSHRARGVFATGLPTKEDLDDYERAILASSGSEASPQRQQDQDIVHLAERLRMNPEVDDEEPRPFEVGRGGK